MFRGHNNIICKGLRIFPFKTGPYKMFVMSSDLEDAKLTKNMCRGIQNNTEEVFDGMFNLINSDKRDLLSENESKDDIFGLRQASYT